jgi:dihydrofolate reductase
VARLVYSAITSLDGYIEDARGDFSWAAPDEEVHAFVNDCERDIGTYLYGRRMYETMRFWETASFDAGESAVSRDYAEIWRRADKIVFSTTLRDPSTGRTRLEPAFGTDLVGQLKAQSERDLSVGGPDLAGQALAAGLVDEISLFLHPIAVGAGKPALPVASALRLELQEQRRFRSGVVYLRYDVADAR